MSLCTFCGLEIPEDEGLCPHHHAVAGDDWHRSNRIMCDFFHRRRIPRRLGLVERVDDQIIGGGEWSVG